MITTKVTMTPEELAEYKEFKERKAKETQEALDKKARKEYSRIVDETVVDAISALQQLSDDIVAVKRHVFEEFRAVKEIKKEVVGFRREEQRSHTFTTSDNKLRIMLGVNTIDAYSDMVEEGIAIVKQYIESLARDDNSRALVRAVLRLLSKDKNGTIKASRLLQLRKMADDTGDELFKRGVAIIEESYQPTVTKRYIRAQCRNEAGGWSNIPLSITDA